MRESGVYCEIWPFTATDEKIREFNPRGIILSGSPASVHDENAPAIPEIVFSLNRPVLGICYGQQALSLIHISEPTRHFKRSRMPSSA